MTPEILDADVQAVTAWMANRPDTKSVASFVPGPGIQKGCFATSHEQAIQPR